CMSSLSLLHLRIPHPPRSTLFPYTTLFRSEDYDYTISKSDPKNHYWSSVVKKCDGKLVNSSKYGFWFKPRPNGSGVYLSKLHVRSEEHTSELESRENLVCRLLLEKKKRETR